MKSIKIVLVIVASVFGAFHATAQERSIQEIHSMMVYNFMKYVNWPPASNSGDFVIGVLGESKVHETLNKWYGTKSKGSQKIVIKKFSSTEEIVDCHVLYIGKSKSGGFDEVQSKLAGKSTLVITDRSGMGKKGSGINFKTVNGKLKFELNQEAISSANLKVSSQLTGMAILI
jgi:hypothetical protein